MKMADIFFNFQMHNNHRGRRIIALRLYDFIPIFTLIFLLYLWLFSSIVRMVMKNGRTSSPEHSDMYLNETHFDLLFLTSLPEKTEYNTPADEPQRKSTLSVNNGGTGMPESLNQSRFYLVSLASADRSSVSPTTPPPLPRYQQANDTTLPPPRRHSTTAISPPPLTHHQIQEQQLHNILEALIGAGDFAGWANLLSSADPSSLPLTGTFFIPGNDAISNRQTPGDHGLDPFLIAYHIIPQRLSFSDLQQFKPNTRISTLSPSKFIVITNNSLFNFTIDGSQITYPDLYVNSAFTVHGVDKVLEYSVYGADPLFYPHVKSPPINKTVPDADVATPSPPLKPKSVLPSFFSCRRKGFY